MDQMTYWVARDHIKSGDIIHVYRPTGWQGIVRTIVYGLIKLCTRSNIYHNAVAMWMTTPSGEQKLMVVESNIHGGKRIVPLSIYNDRMLEVQALPAQFKFSDMEPLALQRVGVAPYGLLDFIAIGVHDVFGIKIKDFPNDVCSELCAKLWVAAGVPIKDTVISPGDLRQVLLDLGIPITIKTF